MNMRFDHRFLAKLALGIGYCLFGRKALESEYGKELHNGLWYRELPSDQQGPPQPIPKIRGTTLLGHDQDKALTSFIGESHAVTLILMRSSEGVAVQLNLGKEHSWTVMCASYEGLEDSDLEYLGDGVVIVLYKYLQKGIVLPLPDYLNHKLGNTHHAELAAINEQIGKHKKYFQNL